MLQQQTGHFRSVLIITCLAIAALIAPLSVFADTSPPAATPPPTDTPAPPVTPVPAVPTGAIRIGVGRSQTAAEISATGSIAVVADGAVQWQSPAGQVLKVTLAAGQIKVQGIEKGFAGPVRFVPVQPAPAQPELERPPVPTPPIPPAPANPISYKGKRYRGEIEVLLSPASKGAAFSVVNVVNLEEYLLGVVPYEMSPSWPVEALKAQAVAARTYSLRHVGQFASEGFDMVDTELSQAYGGIQREDPRTTAAVAATYGEVLTYNGVLAQTFYFSSSGGATENNEIAFRSGTPIPYLRSVPDFDNQPGNKYFSWQKSFSLEQLSTLIQSRYQVGPVKDLVQVGQASSSGRPSLWQVTGELGAATVTGEQLRSVLGLLAAPKSVDIKRQAVAASGSGGRTISVVGADGKVTTRTTQGAVVVGAGGAVTAAPAGPVALGAQGSMVALTVPQKIETTVEFSGGGWGHGVGMSQWGAYGLAQLGRGYRDILAHYYQGTKVETR